MLWSSVQTWANEMPRFEESGIHARMIMAIAEPQDENILVMAPGVSTVDKVGSQQLAVAQWSPAHWVAMHRVSDQETIAPVESTEIAAEEFKKGKVKAAILNEADEYLIRSRPGTRSAVQLGSSSHLVYVLIAREGMIRDASPVLMDMVKKWMDANHTLKTPSNAIADFILSNPDLKNTTQPTELIQAQVNHAHFADLEDNVRLFGIYNHHPVLDSLFREALPQWPKVMQPPEASEAREDRFIREIADSMKVPALPALPQLCTSNANVQIKDRAIVHFDTGKTQILDPAPLEHIANTLYSHSATQACIVGYTDSVGADAKNKNLSRQRADAIVDYLLTQYYFFDASRAIPTGAGKSPRVASNASPEGRAKNRRAEIRVVMEGKE